MVHQFRCQKKSVPTGSQGLLTLSTVATYVTFGVAMLTFLSCKAKTVDGAASSDLNIIGGVQTAEHGYVAKLVMDPEGKTSSEQALCTGVFINRSTVVTSSHCLQAKDGQYATQPTVTFEKEGKEYTVPTTAVFGYSDLVGLKQIPTALVHYDLAFVQVVCDEECPQKDLNFPAIANQLPRQGSPVTLVGYGQDSLEKNQKGDAVKRSGTNVVQNVRPSAITVSLNEKAPGSSRQAVATFGDSGGPLLNQEGHLLGIGSAFTQKDGVITNYFSPTTGEIWDALMKEYAYKTEKHPGGSKGYLFSLKDADREKLKSGEKADSMFFLLGVVVGAALMAKSKSVTVKTDEKSNQVVLAQYSQSGGDVKATSEVTVNAPYTVVKQNDSSSPPGTQVAVTTSVNQVKVREQTCYRRKWYLVCYQ